MNKIMFVLLSFVVFPSFCLAQAPAVNVPAVNVPAVNVPAVNAPVMPMAANPEGIAVLDFKAEFESGIADHLSYFQEKCGFALQTDFNIGNLSQGTSEENRYSVSSLCAIPLTELSMICEKGEAYKALVVKKIKKFTCRFMGNSEKLSLTLEDSNLIWAYENGATNQSGYANKILTGLL